MCTWLIIVLLAIYIRFMGTFLTMFSDWWNLLSFSVVYLIVILLIYLLEKSIEYYCCPLKLFIQNKLGLTLLTKYQPF